jgi:hypothetical protein
MQDPDWIFAERTWIRPALAEAEVQVTDGRAFDRDLDVVPGRRLPEHRRHRLALWITEVIVIVATAVAEVDAADEGDVRGGPAPVADDNELLVV